MGPFNVTVFVRLDLWDAKDFFVHSRFDLSGLAETLQLALTLMVAISFMPSRRRLSATFQESLERSELSSVMQEEISGGTPVIRRGARGPRDFSFFLLGANCF